MINNKIVLGYIGNGKSTNRYHLPFVMQRPDKFIVKTIYNPRIHHDIWDKIEGVNYTENQDDIFLDDESNGRRKSEMKLYEICFSPTSGTKKVTDMLAEEFRKDTVFIDLTDSRKDFSSIAFEEDSIAILAVPSYGGRSRANFRDPWKRYKGHSYLRLWESGV